MDNDNDATMIEKHGQERLVAIMVTAVQNNEG